MLSESAVWSIFGGLWTFISTGVRPFCTVAAAESNHVTRPLLLLAQLQPEHASQQGFSWGWYGASCKYSSSNCSESLAYSHEASPLCNSQHVSAPTQLGCAGTPSRSAVRRKE
jgi:hypothetical protein